jgi:hypothetical protein
MVARELQGDHLALRATEGREVGGMSGEKAEAIRRLKGAFRTAMTGGRVVMTAGINALLSA